MPKKDNIKTFIDKIYSKPPMRIYPTNKIVYNFIDEKWSIDLADFSDYKTINIKGYGYLFYIIDNFSKYLYAIPLKKQIWCNNNKRIFKYYNIIKTKTSSNRIR